MNIYKERINIDWQKHRSITRWFLDQGFCFDYAYNAASCVLVSHEV